MWDLCSLTRDHTLAPHPPALEAWWLNHWTVRKVTLVHSQSFHTHPHTPTLTPTRYLVFHCISKHKFNFITQYGGLFCKTPCWNTRKRIHITFNPAEAYLNSFPSYWFLSQAVKKGGKQWTRVLLPDVFGFIYLFKRLTFLLVAACGI